MGIILHYSIYDKLFFFNLLVRTKVVNENVFYSCITFLVKVYTQV